MAEAISSTWALDKRESYDIGKLFQKPDKIDQFRASPPNEKKIKRSYVEMEPQRKFVYLDQEKDHKINMNRSVMDNFERTLENKTTRLEYTYREIDQFMRSKNHGRII